MNDLKFKADRYDAIKAENMIYESRLRDYETKTNLLNNELAELK